MVWERAFPWSVVASEVTCVSAVELVELGGELFPGAKLVSTMSEVFSRSEVRGEVMLAKEEELLSGNVVATG